MLVQPSPSPPPTQLEEAACLFIVIANLEDVISKQLPTMESVQSLHHMFDPALEKS
jgi:hypothetical protein